MIVKKLTDKYNFREENGKYFLSFGTISKAEDTSTKLRIENIDSNNLEIKVTCGCTETNKTIIDNSTVESIIKIITTGVFEKTVLIKNGKEQKELILTGRVI